MTQTASREDMDAFGEVFRRRYRSVFGIFTRFGCSHEDCEDLTSETFRRAYGSFGEFRGEAKLSTWLHTIATNVWRNHLRDRSTGKRDGIEVPIPDDGQAGATFQDGTDDRAVAAERRRLLRSAIDDLPPKMRRCVWLRVYQDWSFAEIADVLGVSPGTAKSHFSLARSRLRPLLATHYPELDENPGDD